MAGTSPAMNEHLNDHWSWRREDVGSQSQDRLRDDVLLNLVGAAINRSLAPVEISRRDRPSPFRADRWLVPTIVVLALGLVRHRVGTDDLEQQFSRRLLNFRAL